jgi:hypothetical protein
MTYQSTGSMPALEGIDPTMMHDIAYQTSLGKGYSAKEYNEMDINSVTNLIAAFDGNREVQAELLERRQQLVEQKLISNGLLGQDQEQAKNSSLNQYLISTGLMDENFKSVLRENESWGDYTKRYNQATQTYEKSPIGSLLNGISSSATNTAALGKLDGLLANQQISDNEYKSAKDII